MHAFLIIGNTGWAELAKKLKAKILEFPLKKIEDVRSLNNLIRLSFDKPTLIVCENVHEATEEALNAFLKSLEEPQENIYFALTAPSTNSLLPTIVSRCQILKIRNSTPEAVTQFEIRNKDQIINFLNLKTNDKLTYADQVKDRGEAIGFMENIINYFHEQVHEGGIKVGNIEAAIKTLTALRANGNVNLQLTNFVINLG